MLGRCERFNLRIGLTQVSPHRVELYLQLAELIPVLLYGSMAVIRIHALD